MKKIILVLIFLTLLFLSPSSVVAGGPKYTMRERFGVGSDGGNAMGKQGNGWYFSWWYGPGRYANNNIDFMGLLAAGATDVPGSQPEKAPDTPASVTCQKYKNIILGKGKQFYPDNMMWTIGNEIGWDDGRTADKYADDFVKWYGCLKSINPTFQVGSGGLVDTYTKLPRDWSQGCTSTPDIDGASAYFRTYMTKLKNVYQVIPDFFVAHAYTWCRPGTTTTTIPGGYTVGVANVQDFKNLIVAHRQLLAEFGLQKKDLIMNEWADFSGNSVNYLKDTVNYLMTATDQNTGNPDDEYRLVQKWAWFIFVDTPNDFPEWKNAWLSIAGILTPLGEAYKAMIPDPSPVGSYSTYQTTSCTIYGWACDGSYFDKPIQVDIYANDVTTNNQSVYVGSPVTSIAHNPADPVVRNSCGGIDSNHDFTFTLPANSQFRDGREHAFLAAGINIDSTGTRVDNDPAGNSKHTWFGAWYTNKMTCALPTPSPTPLPLPGDINHDNKVNLRDYSQLVTDFGKTGSPGFVAADINNDGNVDIFDYNILVGGFGKTQ